MGIYPRPRERRSGRRVVILINPRACPPEILEIESLFTQTSRPGRTVGVSVGGILEMDSSDWSIGFRSRIFNTRPDAEF